jgi:hypothetical protein
MIFGVMDSLIIFFNIITSDLADMKLFNYPRVNLVLCYISKIGFHFGAVNNTDNIQALVNVRGMTNENKFPGLGVIKIFSP